MITVAPLTGAWIEILKVILDLRELPALFSLECGLKWKTKEKTYTQLLVVPLTGARIEIWTIYF